MLPKDCEVFSFDRFCWSAKKGHEEHLEADTTNSKSLRRNELVIRRFSKVTPRKEILNLYESGKFDCFTGEKFKAGPNGEVLKMS